MLKILMYDANMIYSLPFNIFSENLQLDYIFKDI